MFRDGVVAMDPDCCCESSSASPGSPQTCIACGDCCFGDLSTVTITDTATPLPNTGDCTWSLTEGGNTYTVTFSGTVGTNAWSKVVNSDTPTLYDGNCCGSTYAGVVVNNNKCCKVGLNCCQSPTNATCDDDGINTCCMDVTSYSVTFTFKRWFVENCDGPPGYTCTETVVVERIGACEYEWFEYPSLCSSSVGRVKLYRASCTGAWVVTVDCINSGVHASSGGTTSDPTGAYTDSSGCLVQGGYGIAELVDGVSVS